MEVEPCRRKLKNTLDEGWGLMAVYEVSWFWVAKF